MQKQMYLKTSAVISVLFLIFPLLVIAEEEPSKVFQARVVEIQDGDTLTVVRENLDLVKVRLYGVDAPEAGQPFGDQAAKKLKRLAHKKIVTIEAMQKRDRYGRVVGLVKHGGRDLGREMAKAGLAWVDPRYCDRRQTCNGYWAAVRQAQKQKQGLWRKPDQTPPWVWRD